MGIMVKMEDSNAVLSFLEKISLGSLAIIFGAIAHIMAKWYDIRNKRLTDESVAPFTIIDFIILFTIATFTGWMFTLALEPIVQSERILQLSGGMGGFLGLAGLHWLADVFKKSVGNRLNKILGGETDANEKDSRDGSKG